MTKITCACFDCKHCSENAECTANEIKLTSGNIATVWEGRQDVWWCKSFEMSEEAKDCYKRIAEFLKGGSDMFGFAEDTKDMTAAEILNYYRNRYYAEPQVTERGIVANAINDYFKESASKSAWISVDERLPDPGLPILIFTRKNRYYVGYYYKAVVDTTYTGFYADSVKRDVTHWMPMPEPPITDKPTQEQ